MPETNLKSRLANGERLIGTFLKTPSPIVVEVLGTTTLDFIVIDVEHAPFGRLELDTCLMAARSVHLSSLVRVASSSAHHVLQALDSGADGVLVPHVLDAEQARGVVASAHYVPGGRGFAGSTRAAGYTTRKFRNHMDDSARNTVVIAQIEDIEAVSHVEEIAAVDGLDAVFVGPVDLAVSMSATGPDDPKVTEVVAGIADRVRPSGRPLGIFVASVADIPKFTAMGFGYFIAQSDHVFLRNGATALMT